MKVPRGDKILDWAVNVLKLHANRKSILEVNFIYYSNEENTKVKKYHLNDRGIG